MPTIRIKRSRQFTNLLRSYIVLLDGQKVGKLGFGGQIEVPVAAGPHTLRLKIDWCSSNEIRFTVAEGETVTFECSSVSPLLSLYYVLFNHRNFLILKQMS